MSVVPRLRNPGWKDGHWAELGESGLRSHNARSTTMKCLPYRPLFHHLQSGDTKHVLYKNITRIHEIIWVKHWFLQKSLYKIIAQLLFLHYDELMKWCLKSHIPPPPKKKKKNSSWKRKQTRNDLIIIAPATPKGRHSSEKQNSFPSAMN